MTSKNIVAGCVVLFNANIDVLNNIETYQIYVNKLFIIDNSSSPNPLIVDYVDGKSNIVYIPLNDNTGIANALNVACELALNEGFEWILTMDQDSKFVSKEIFDYDYKKMQRDGVAIVAAAYTKNVNRKVFENENLLSVNTVITSGNILQLEAWLKVGKFKNFMFIDEVDNEFCLRLKLASYLILVTRQLGLSHNLGEKISATFIYKNLLITIHSPLRVYYMVRNTFYISKLYVFKFPLVILERLYTLTKSVIKIIFFYKSKGLYCRYIYYGISDFLKSKYGKFEVNRQKV